MDASAERLRCLSASGSTMVSAFADLPLPLFLLDDDLRITYANVAAESLAETTGSLVGRVLPDLPGDFAVAQLEARCRTVLADHQAVVLPFLHSADARWYQVHLSPLREGGIVALWQPMPAGHELRQRLHAAEEQLHRMFSATPLGLAVTELNGSISQTNEAFALITGYSREELVGRTFRSLTHPDEPAINIGLLRQQGARDVTVLRTRLLTRSGEPLWARITVSIARDSEGQAAQLLTVCENIDEQYRSEQKLRASEWRFRSLIESTTDVIVIVLPDGTTSYISPSLERALGYRPDERIGLSILDGVHPDDLPAVRREMTESLTRYGTAVNLEFRVRHKDNSWRTLEVTGRNLIHNPVIGGLVLSCRDVTERVEARTKIREYSTELERQQVQLLETLTDSGLSAPRLDLLTSIAEEIRTPIIGVAGIADLLLETRLEPAQRECAERIRDSSQNLLSVVDGFLRMSASENAR